MLSEKPKATASVKKNSKHAVKTARVGLTVAQQKAEQLVKNLREILNGFNPQELAAVKAIQPINPSLGSLIVYDQEPAKEGYAVTNPNLQQALKHLQELLTTLKTLATNELNQQPINTDRIERFTQLLQKTQSTIEEINKIGLAYDEVSTQARRKILQDYYHGALKLSLGQKILMIVAGIIGGIAGALIFGLAGAVLGGGVGSVLPFFGTLFGASVGAAASAFVGTGIGFTLGTNIGLGLSIATACYGTRSAFFKHSDINFNKQIYAIYKDLDTLITDDERNIKYQFRN